MIRRMLDRLPPRWRWMPHNVIAHPLSEVLWQLGAHRAADFVHDATVPTHDPEQSRG